MKIVRTLALATVLGLGSITYAAPVINNNNQSVSLTLRGENFVVNGNNNTVRLRGKCHTLTVNGNGNTITTNELGHVVANGNRNKVTWRKGAQISNYGVYNSLRRTRK